MKNNHLALGGLFACLHVIFLIMSKIIVGSELLLVLLLPLLSTLYVLKSDKKNVIMFVISTVLVCSIFDIVSTFIYVVPSLICGTLYGVLRQKKFKELELLYVSSLAHSFSLAFSFFVIALLFKEVDFMEIFSSILRLEGKELIVATLVFLLLSGIVEALIVHIITDNELERFASKVEKNKSVPRWFLICLCISFVTLIGLHFVDSLYCVFPLIFVYVFGVPYIVWGIKNFRYKIATFSLMVLFFFVSLFVMKYLSFALLMCIPLFIMSPLAINVGKRE